MIIKVTYNVTDVYMSTTSNPIYINVSYGDGGGASVWGQITGTLSDQTDLQNALDAKVPYSGATANVDLGEYELKAGQIEYDQTPTGVAGVATTRWNDTVGTIETTLKGGNVVLKHGRDMFERVVNKTGVQLTRASYQAVRVSTAQGQRLGVALAQANNDNNSADTIGLAVETIDNNQEGMIYTVGEIDGINTTGSLQGETWSDGDVLYLSPTTAGRITNVKPIAPQHLVVIGYVVYAHANNGKIYVKVMNGWELGELHDVDTTGATNGQVLTYNGSIWVPTTNGAGTVTSVAATAGTGISISGSPITSSGTLTITNTAPDQTVSLTQGGTTTITGTYPNFTISSADQFTGTVTSVGLTSTTTGVTITGSPITTSGSLTLDIATASGSTTGLLSSTDWTTFNNKQNALTNPVTGTGTSGQVAYWSGTTTQTGSNNLFWDSANNRLGIGIATPSAPLHIVGTGSGGGGRTWARIQNTQTNSGSGIQLVNANNRFASFQYTGSAYTLGESFSIFTESDYPLIFITNGNGASGGTSYISFSPGGYANESARFTSTKNLLIGTTTDSGQRLQVQGTTLLNGSTTISGSTTAASAIARGAFVSSTLVAAANNDVLVGLDIQPTFTIGAFTGTSSIFLRLRDSGNNNLFRFTSNRFVISDIGGGGGININDGNCSIARDVQTNPLRFQNTRANSTSFEFGTNSNLGLNGTSGSNIFTSFISGFEPTSGTATFSQISQTPTINQTGGANGITRGLYVNPTLTAAADWRSVEMSNNSGWGIYQSGASANNYFAGKIVVGTTTVSTFNLDVNGTARVSGNFRFDSNLRDNRDNSIITQSLSSVISNRILTIGNATYASVQIPNAKLFVGTTTDAGFTLDVNGTARVQGALTVTGSTTAASAIARGANFTPTLVAAANNDVLVGLDIAPTFTNGAFTGVTNLAARVQGILSVINTTSQSSLTVSSSVSSVVFFGNASGSNTASIELQSSNTRRFRILAANTNTTFESSNQTGTFIFNNTVAIDDAKNLSFGSTTGTKIGTSTSQKIGFWNATPIIQPTTAVAEATFVENSGGTAVNVDSTFAGYTLQQIAQALKDLGILA